MAITINQQPTYPNVTQTHLLYAVSSDNVSQPQFQYVMDIVSGSTRMTRVKQYPNPAGTAIYDVAKILDDYLEYPTDIFNTSSTQGYGSSLQTFSVRFGEEYGATISSDVFIYDGSGSVGDPIVSGSDAVVWPGTIDPNNGLGYNWSDVYGDNLFLSDYPNTQELRVGKDYKKVSLNDYGLLAFKGSNITGSVTASFYNSAGSTLQTLDITSTQDTSGTYIPSGFKNFETLLSGSALTNTDWYKISVGGAKDYYFKVEQDCHWDRANFLFINKYGTWDFHGISLPKTKRTLLDRSRITKPFVDYSSTTSQYNIQRRGHDYYNINLEDIYTITTDYLTEAQAEWLSEMIESPSVFLQQDDKFVPIIVTNANYIHSTNIRTQKLFRYTIEYQFSNQRMSR
jgi:disulfide oxidoreductase YuzD